MLAIEVELLHETIRIGSPDDLALSGQEDLGEWPPSPARLFAALVAAGGTRERSLTGSAPELSTLESTSPPRIVADDPADVLGPSGVADRYVVKNERAKKGAVQEYVARENTLVRPSPRMAPKTPLIRYEWPDLELSATELAGLRVRVGRIGYLGCADSPVRVSVSTEVSDDDSGMRAWLPDDRANTALPIPFTGLTRVLDRIYDDFSGGRAPRRSWYRTDRRGYLSPREATTESRPECTCLWVRFARTVSGRHVLHVTEALRGAVLAEAQRIVGDAIDLDPVLHGHGFSGRGYEHAHWLALPDVGGDYSTGRIHGGAVMLPPGIHPATVDLAREAIARVSRLNLPGGRSITVVPYRGERKPWAIVPRRWHGPTPRWTSAFPVVHERWTKGTPDLAEIGRWCEYAGLPRPLAATTSRRPVLTGAPDLMPHETTRKGRDRRPYSYLEIEFSEPVRGPVVLGRRRHFGVGLMAPLPERADGEQS